MDERMKNLNLAEMLKDCPEGTKLYSPIFGEVELVKVYNDENYPIEVKLNNGALDYFAKDGRIYIDFDGGCLLFPSKEERDWNKFKLKKIKFDPKTLQPFDKVLVRDKDCENWNCGFFSHKDASCVYPYRCIGTPYIYCIPYNEETKHLVGTADEAPEYYRYWEE